MAAAIECLLCAVPQPDNNSMLLKVGINPKLDSYENSALSSINELLKVQSFKEPEFIFYLVQL